MKAYEPLSWVVAFLVGALLVSAVFGVGAWFRALIARARYLNNLEKPENPINPFDSTFSRKRIYHRSLADPVTRMVNRKTLVECEIIGPGAAVFSGYDFGGGTILGNVDLIEIDMGLSSKDFCNLTIFNDCTFRDCKIYNLVLLF